MKTLHKEGRMSGLEINNKGKTMKKFFVVLLAVCLIATFISCSNEAKVDERVNVSFGVDQTRSLSSSASYADFSTLDWYYQATTESQFDFGKTTNWTKLDNGLDTILELSQGIWDFDLCAVTPTADPNNNVTTKVYEGSRNGVLVQKGDKAQTITIDVVPGGSGKGTIVISSNIVVNKKTADGSYEATTVKANNWSVVNSDSSFNQSGTFEGDKKITEVPAGDYTVTVSYNDVLNTETNTYVIRATEPIDITVYANSTITVKGSIDEETQAVVIKPISTYKSSASGSLTPNEDAKVSVDVTPAMTSSTSQKTTVTIPSSMIKDSTEDGKVELVLDVTVTPAKEASSDNSFVASSGSAVAAAIDINLSLDRISQTTGFTTPVKVETYVAKNLSGFSFCFPGETWTKKNSLEEVTAAKDYYYDSTEGKLTFLTDHFSSFIVETSSVAVIENMAYATLVEALDAAVAGDVVNVINDSKVVLNDTSDKFNGADSSLWYDTENVTLDFCGNTFTVKSNYGGSYNVLNIFGSGWTIKNGEIIVTRGESNEDDSYSLGIEIKNGTITIDNMTLHGGIALYDTVNATLKDTNFVMATNYYAIYLEGGASATIEGGEYKSNGSKPIIYACENCEATITGGSFDGNLKGGKGSITINGGSFTDLDSAINYASSGTTITMLKDSEGKGIGSKDAGKATYREKLTIDFANHTYTMMDPAVGSTGTESQAMHWGKSLGNITMKNGTFKVAENTSGVFMAMQNYINFTAENMVFDFSSIPVVSYDEDEFSGDYAIFNGLEVPMFNNNSGKMILKNTTITMPSNSNKGLSAGGDGVEIISSIINGAINLMEESESVKVKDTTISKGVVSYFNNGSTIASSTEGEYTVYRLETV